MLHIIPILLCVVVRDRISPVPVLVILPRPVSSPSHHSGTGPGGGKRQEVGKITLRPFSYAWLYTLEVILVEALVEASKSDVANSSSSTGSSSVAASMGGGCSEGGMLVVAMVDTPRASHKCQCQY